MIVVIGLGNVGKAYEQTYHNAGFIVLDKLAEEFGFVFSKTKYKSQYADTKINGKKVIFLKPNTYMNNSGVAVAEVMRKLKVDSENILVVYDDIDLPIGTTRFRDNGGTGTHNGMRSIVSHIGTNNFPRLRVGIEGGKYFDISDYVLSKISKDHLPLFENSVNDSISIIKDFIQNK